MTATQLSKFPRKRPEDRGAALSAARRKQIISRAGNAVLKGKHPGLIRRTRKVQV